ncbi:uncharacterized protein LOC117652228 [Thrips palmi]|uniref:Uncharacterized protein LOC117652228 n=1 Tax=Thrips palmi TaxID=161013 RepID=A0A6P9A6I6_THRPL|nr:uncharacterized protein LOC117652228 [Thrips palmi]
MGCGSSKGSVVPLEGGLTGNGVAPHAPHGPHGLPSARVPGSGQSRGPSRGPSRGAASRRASLAPAIVGKDPPEEDLPKELPELREIVRAAGGKAMAFEVPLSDLPADGEDGAPRESRRPPRRLQRLEDAPVPPSQRLTHRLLDERQEAAEERRSQILSQRVQSAQPRAPKRRGRDADADNGLNSSGSYIDSLANSRDSRNGEFREMLAGRHFPGA